METDEAKDAALVRAHVQGEASAFAELYDRHDRASFQFLRRLLGSAHADAADDLHQETWIAVARNASRFDPARARFTAWLFTIARRKAFDYFRRRKGVILALTGLDGAADQVADSAPSPLEQVESRESAERIAAAVEALPLEQRSAFLLFSIAGLSLQEIAEVTGAPIETAKSRLRYARAALRRTLAGERSAHV
jgi:RNA polymerase sigma-70 factor (ECF subfamily)